MTDKNVQFVLHTESFNEIASILTEFAQMKRVVGQHEEASKAETVRNTLYSQHSPELD